ncbi:uncharacterized protein STEHIDRAFT_164055 [Stereum hirsutum FP-91666 SS1]|uniref:Uncharacterized protein n=1 Tax=Stereum hirsutum (strain FP-91666) TaxID=721885 RepID=R7RWD6_STEHR|nr:uncharacterized protein STEHIDRAFT_164055 [Stereum hirsutum FP-91666 SS1]EIM79053.1 hypothetical protein STEHIDRAFT_164055 [Stereum hirsutum FP-91666 SS1]
MSTPSWLFGQNISAADCRRLTTSHPDLPSDFDTLTNLSKKRPVDVTETTSATVAKRQKTHQLLGKMKIQIAMAETTQPDSAPQYFEPDDSGLDRFRITYIMRLRNVSKNQPKKAGKKPKEGPSYIPGAIGA